MIDFWNFEESKEYKKWMIAEIKEYHTATSPKISYSEYLSKACWFVTTTFSRRDIDRRQGALGWSRSNTKLQLDDFDTLYRQFASVVNPRGETGAYPFAIMSLDFEGSRGAVSVFENTNVHCHAIICVPYDQAEAASRYINSFRFKYALRVTSIDSLDVRSYERELDRKKKLVTYVAKGFIKPAQNPSSGEELRLYLGHRPNFKINHYRPRKYSGRGTLSPGKLRTAVQTMKITMSRPQYQLDTDVD